MNTSAPDYILNNDVMTTRENIHIITYIHRSNDSSTSVVAASESNDTFILRSNESSCDLQPTQLPLLKRQIAILGSNQCSDNEQVTNI